MDDGIEGEAGVSERAVAGGEARAVECPLSGESGAFAVQILGMRRRTSVSGTRDQRIAAVGIAQALEATVVGCDVRTALDRDILADLGVDAANGPLFGPALPAPVFRQAVRRPLHA